MPQVVEQAWAKMTERHRRHPCGQAHSPRPSDLAGCSGWEYLCIGEAKEKRVVAVQSGPQIEGGPQERCLARGWWSHELWLGDI